MKKPDRVYYSLYRTFQKSYPNADNFSRISLEFAEYILVKIDTGAYDIFKIDTRAYTEIMKIVRTVKTVKADGVLQLNES